MKIYVTRWALSKGILEIEAEETEYGFRAEYPPSSPNYGYFMCFQHTSKSFHLTRELAVKQAEEMRQAKLKMLKKQLMKLEAITFE